MIGKGTNKPLEEMSLHEVDDFLSSIMASTEEEYQKLKSVWGEKPTPRQAKQLEKLHKRLSEARSQQQKLRSLLSRYGVEKN